MEIDWIRLRRMTEEERAALREEAMKILEGYGDIKWGASRAEVEALLPDLRAVDNAPNMKTRLRVSLRIGDETITVGRKTKAPHTHDAMVVVLIVKNEGFAAH